MRYRAAGLILITTIAALSGCQTVTRAVSSFGVDYSQLPEAPMREIAAEIENAVAAGNRDAEIASREGIVLDNDLIRQAIRTRAARSELIDAFRTAGWGLEQKNGLISIQRTREYKKGTTKRDRDRHAVLVMGENNDRWALYEGLVESSDFPPGALNAIQAIFAEARIPVPTGAM